MNQSLQQAMQTSRSTRPLPGELQTILAAEQIIARMTDAEHDVLKQQINAAPNDGFLRLWNGLALAARQNHAAACDEFFRASELGCNNWRVGWYLAQSAKAVGNLPLVDEACEAVLRANKEFWFARELPKHARGFYAQGEHDKLIEAFFQKHPPRSRVFVEVGAFDGVHYSNVRRLVERHGWSGVSIEPVAKNFAKLESSYRGSKVRCVRACVSNNEGEVELNVSTYPHLPDWGSDVASISGEDTDRWRKQYGAVWTKEKVPVRRLTSIIDEAGVTDVDLLSVDAEGYDLEVLRSLDFERFKPQLIVVEYGKEREAILRFLEDRGYSLSFDNKQDLFMAQPRSLKAVRDVTRGRPNTERFAPKERERILAAVNCHDCDDVPKVAHAGEVLPGNPPVQLMHNGVKIIAGSYHGEWMTEIIRQLRGHHEPQEEKVFCEVLKTLPPGAVMIEAGSFWAYYSMWFHKAIPGAKNHLIEPNKEKFELSQHHFALNEMTGVFTNGFIGRESNPEAVFVDWDNRESRLPQIAIDDYVRQHGIEFIHVLHADIQGAELDMLLGCRETIAQNKIGCLFLSTHGDRHPACLKFLADHGFRILAQHTIAESSAADGLIVACSPAMAGLNEVRISKRSRVTSDMAAELRVLSAGEIPAALEKLNPHLLKLDTLPVRDGVRYGQIDPLRLVTPERFDLLVKFIYAQHRAMGVNSEWARELYRAHISAFSKGTFREGDGQKSRIEDYFEAFHDTLDSIGTNGFDPQQTLVPIGRNNVIVDGAHRVAACLLHRQPVSGLFFDHAPSFYGADFFEKRGLAGKHLDAAALEYCRLKPNTYIVTVFPAAQGRGEEVCSILNELGRVVYAKSVALNRNGALNLIKQVYVGEKWLGDWSNNFAGAAAKVDPCFKAAGPVRVYVVEAQNVEAVKEAKVRIRALFGIGNHSVHINDTHEQTIYLGQILLNDNSVHFLNHARPRHLERFHKHLALYSRMLVERRLNPEHFCVDGSATMAAYGIRDAQDLDFLHFGCDDLKTGSRELSSHNSEVHHHVTTRDDIIFNPENHFYYFGIKFASLDIIRKLKTKRNEGKDQKDVAAIARLLGEALGLATSQAAFTAVKAGAKIVALVPARNEGAKIAFCFRALSKFADAIVYLDDCSDDGETLPIVESIAAECRVERIIRKAQWHRDEPGDRNALLRAGREIGGTHFVVIDADEAFTANCADGEVLRRKILSLEPGEQLSLTWIQLWRSPEQYRFDNSVWTNNSKTVIFCDDGKCSYSSEFIHTPRVPANLKGRTLSISGYTHGLLHFQFVNWRNLLLKQAWYRCIERVRDPQKPAAEINKRYAPSKDETGLGLKPSPTDWFAGYPFFDRSVFDAPDRWREQQMLGWFDQYGRDRFKDLDIWDIAWGQAGDVQRSPASGHPARSSKPERSGDDLTQGFIDLAEGCFNCGEFAAARDHLERAADVSDDRVDLLIGLANLDVQLNELNAARTHLLRAVELAPADASTHVLLASVCLRLQQVEEFEQAVATALKINSEEPGALRLLAGLNLEHGRFKDAAQFYFRLLKQNEADTDALLSLGVCFFKTGDRATARSLFERVLQFDPEHSLARENLSACGAPVSSPSVEAVAVVEQPVRAADGAAPIISAIISTYNSEHFLRHCLEDLEAQTIADRLEIIVVDSGSPQNERAIVEEFQKRYSNIRYLRTERETIYTAWNRGVQMARGKYLTNANADDRHTRDAYEKLVAALETRPDCALAYADVAICENVHPDRGYTEIRGYFRWPEFDVRLLFRDCYMGPQPVWRRAVHERHGLFDPTFKSAGDYEFWLRLARTEKFLHVPEVLGLYWNTPQTAGHANPGLTRKEADTARERHWPKEWGARPKPGFSCVEPTAFVRQTQQTVSALQARVRALESDKARLEADVQRWMTGEAPADTTSSASVPTAAESDSAAALALLRSAQEKLRERKFSEADSEVARYREMMNPDGLARRDSRTAAAPLVSVVIVSYQAGEALLDCIRSVNLSTEVEHEIILVDNGGNESVKDALASLPLLHIPLPVNIGPAEARNIGAHFARSPILCFLDDDAVAAPGYLASIVKAFETFEIQALRGKVLPKTANQNNRKACHYDLGNVAVPSDLDTEGNSAVRTEAWRNVGGMNPLLFGGEGLELSYRLARQHGDAAIIYWPEAVIHHDYALTDDKLERKQARHEIMRAYALSLHADVFDYHRRVTAFVESDEARRAGAKLVRRKVAGKVQAPAAKPAPNASAAQPFISICIPTYNRAAYLSAAIQSALRQTYPNFEVVVVDDGSTDKTPALLKELASDKVRCFRKEHSGGPETRNRCITEARGGFIVWVDSDDVIFPGTLERYVQAVRREPEVDVFYGNLQLANEQLVHAGIERYRDYHGWPSALLSDLFLENRIPNGFTMIRKACFEKVGGYDRAFPRAHDYEFWTRMAGRCEVKHIDEVVGVYRLHNQSLTKPRGGVDTRYEAAVSKAMLSRHRLQDLLPWCFSEGASESSGEGHAGRIAALQLLKHGDVESAREWLNRAAKAATHPRIASLHHRLVAMHGDVAKGDGPESETDFDRAVDDAVREFRRGRARECARACARLTDLKPDAIETLLLVGSSLLRWGDPQNGRAALHCLLQREIGETATEVADAAERCRQSVSSKGERALREHVASVLGVEAVPTSAIIGALQAVNNLAAKTDHKRDSVSHDLLTPLFFAVLGMTEAEAANLGHTELWMSCATVKRRLAAIRVSARGNARLPGYSFCIITNGRRPEKLQRQIDSIRALGVPAHEILVGGRVLQHLDGVKVFDLSDAAATGNLGLMRNTLAARAQFDHLVISDDDMVFAPDFFPGLERFGEGYDALAVRLANPDGSRFWDWACVGGARGQMLLNYWETSPEVYLTGGICVIKASVWDVVKWDEGRGFYEAEDVDFSRRLQAAGFSIRFNPYARVTHDDDRYTRVGRKVMRLDDVLKTIETLCRTTEFAKARELVPVAERLCRNHPQQASELCALMDKFGGSLSAVTPAPSQTNGATPTAGATISVAWDGSFLDLGSLSHVNRELTRALEGNPGIAVTRLGKNAVPKPLAGMKSIVDCAKQLRAQPTQRAQVTVRHAWPPNWEAPANGAWVLIQPWEFGALPKEWVHNLARVDEAWVPSEYVRRVYIESGVDAAKVHVVPNGIDPEVFRPGVKPMALATTKSFKFLFVGGTILRKGPDVLLKAYLESFTAQDDVCLVIKDFGGQSVYAGQTFEAQVKAAQAKLNAPEILYLNDELPPELLPGLYAACDALVHPYRGEGFSLPILEAMACGLPVVVTAGGAADDFATDEFAYRLPSIRRTFGQSVSGMELVKPGWMLEPDLTALVERMRWLAAHRDEAKAKGRAASEHVRREWTWERAAEKAEARLQTVAARSPRAPLSDLPRKAKTIELPPCARLGHLGEARQLFQAGKLVPAWNSTVTALKARPYHPEAFLLLAEIANAAGDGKRASKLAERARKMAPKYKAARKLAKNSSAKNVMPRLALPALPPCLDPSSDKRPVPRLSVFVITKNEEKFIGRCLESVRDLAAQIVVVDSGSTDWTKAIAERFGAEVHGFEWCDDFSGVRNAALERVTGDWVLMLDADEELLPDQKEKLRALLVDPSAIAWRLPMRDVGREAEGEHYVPRLFRNAPGLFYVGRIHEQIFSSVEVRRQEWGLENKFGDAVLLHHGYTKEMVRSRDKIARNLRLLRLAVEELPGEPNLLMNLGLELVRDGQLAAGLEQYAAAFDAMIALPKGQVTPELRESLITQYSSHLISAKRSAEAVRVLESPLAKSAGLTASMHWLLGLAWIEQRQFAEGATQMRECLSKRARKSFTPADRNILKGGPHHCLALCLAALKQREPADRALNAALEAEPESRKIRFDCARFLAEGGHEVEALKWLHQLATEDASDAQVWICGGQLTLRRPEYLEFANDWTGESFKLHSAHPVIVEQRAMALLLNGDVDGALAVWRQADGAPSASRVAAITLCEVLAGGAVTPVASTLVPDVGREFLQWYRRLLSLNATRLVGMLHEHLERLRPVLPAVAQAIGDAVNEANAVPVK